jgi:hypothetical protein
VTLLPDVASLLLSLSPHTLAQLTSDTAGVAQKLVRLIDGITFARLIDAGVLNHFIDAGVNAQ